MDRFSLMCIWQIREGIIHRKILSMDNIVREGGNIQTRFFQNERIKKRTSDPN